MDFEDGIQINFVEWMGQDWNTTLNSVNETPAPVSPVNTVWGMPPFRCWIDTSQCTPVTNRAWETFCFLRPSITYFSDIDFWKPLCAQKISQSRNLSIRRLVPLSSESYTFDFSEKLFSPNWLQVWINR